MTEADTRWQRVVSALQAEAERLADQAEANGEPVQLPLKLDPVPALTQLMLDSGALTRDHVWYQSSEKLLFGALGVTTTTEQHPTLLRFCQKLSTRDRHLFQGQGAALDPQAIGGDGAASNPPTNPAEYFDKTNFGAFSERTIDRHNPAHPREPGVVLPDVLNLFDAAKRHSRAVWRPRHGANKLNIALVLTLDGMALRIGADLHDAAGDVWGFASRVGLADARAYLAMGEAEQERWREEHPLVEEAVEVMGVAADYSVIGHTGFWLQPKGFDARDVARSVAPFVRKVGHVCEGCMLWGFEMDQGWDAIMARCDLHCGRCDPTGADEEACEVHNGRHYSERAVPARKLKPIPLSLAMPECSAVLARSLESAQHALRQRCNAFNSL